MYSLENTVFTRIFTFYMVCFRYRVLVSTNRYINQFPGEKLVITKDMLAVSGRRATPTDPSRIGPKWLPVTFNLDQALPQFVSYFQQQERK